MLPKEKSFDVEDYKQSNKVEGCSGRLARFRWDLGARTVSEEWKKMFRSETFGKDLTSAASIFCVAVPLNLAISVASSVPPQVAMVTAGVSAIPAALFGGTTLAVTGPAAAMAVLVAQATNRFGLGGLACVTFSVGILQLLSGFVNAGWIVKLTPLSVIAGFTTGVGVIIGSGQLGKLLALPPAGVDASVFELWYHVASHLHESDMLSLGLGVSTLVVARLVPKLHPKAGGFATLAAVAAGTIMAFAAKETNLGDVKTIGVIPPLDLGALFKLPVVSDLFALIPTIVLIYLLCSVESLLSCACLDKMRPTSYPHDASQELIGQGLGNLASGLFSGMPVTSVIARSSLNVRSGGQTRFASLVHAVLVLGGLATLGPALAHVPMPSLAAVLLNTASGMLWPVEAKNSIAVQRTDMLPYVLTVLGMLGLGLAEGVLVGLVGSFVFSGANWNRKETIWFSFKQTAIASVPMHVVSASIVSKMSKETLLQLCMPHCAQNDTLTRSMGQCPHCGGDKMLGIQMSTTKSNVPERCPTCLGSGNVTSKSALPYIWRSDGPLNFLSIFLIADFINFLRQKNGSHIVDMVGCKSVDLTGGEEFLTGIQELRNEGRQVTLMNAPEQFEALLEAHKAVHMNVYVRSMCA